MKKKIGAGVFLIDKKSGKILLCQRSKDSSFPMYWAVFGGTFENKDVTPKKTAKREFWEETDVKSKFKISKEPFYVNSNRFIDFYTYLGISNGQPEIRINEESLSYGWFHLNQLPENLIPGLKEMVEDKMPEIKSLINKLLDSNY